MNLWKIFLIAFVLLLAVYMIIWYLITSYPTAGIGLVFFMMPVGSGASICFILFLVMFILHK